VEQPAIGGDVLKAGNPALVPSDTKLIALGWRAALLQEAVLIQGVLGHVWLICMSVTAARIVSMAASVASAHIANLLSINRVSDLMRRVTAGSRASIVTMLCDTVNGHTFKLAYRACGSQRSAAAPEHIVRHQAGSRG
jgi:hypothetical protein